MRDLTYNDPTVAIVRPSVEDDCYFIGRHLRHQDALEAWNYFHMMPTDVVLRSFNKSVIRMTIEKNEMPIAMFGVMIEEEPKLWLFTTNEFNFINRIFLRHTKEWIGKMCEEYPKLTAYVDIRNRASIRWLMFVGGQVVDTVFMGRDDMPFKKFVFKKRGWDRNKFRWIEEKNFEEVGKKCGCDHKNVIRAVGIWHEDTLCLYLITCDFFGIKSFHGHNFVKNAQWFLLPFARRYVKEEDLKWSNFVNDESRAILKRLGFKYFSTVMRKP